MNSVVAGEESGNSARPAEASVLVSGEGLIVTLQGMQEHCHFIDLLDFCTLAEAIVLNDKIEVVCDIEYAHALSLHSAVVTLQKAGVLSTITTHRGSHAESTARPVSNTPHFALDQYGSNRFTLKGDHLIQREPLGNFTLDQIMDEATSLLRAERELGISVLPMRRFASLYVPNAKVREEHTVCDLMSRYDGLSEDLRLTREQTRFPLSPLVVAKIPPIPITVLEHARDGSEILARILEVRDDFRELREALTRVRTELGDEDIPPKEKKKIVQSWLRSWSTLNKYDVGASVAIGNTTSDILDVDKSLESGVLDFNLSRIFDMLVRAARDRYYRWRVRILHDTADRYLKICDGQIGRDLERLYNKRFGERDLRDLQDWELMISKMTIDLEGMSPKQNYVVERSRS